MHLVHHVLLWGGLGGVLVLLGAARIGSRPPAPAPRGRSAVMVPGVAAASTAAAAGVHWAVAPSHLSEGLLVAGFLLLSGAAQAGLACALLLSEREWPRTATLVLNAGLLLVWAVSRTSGLPGLPVERIGLWDLAAVTWEAVAVVAVVRWRLAGSTTPASGRATSRPVAGATYAALSGLVLVLLPFVSTHA